MTESTHVTLLRRMTRVHDDMVAENPPTASRAVRLTLTKAANDTVGLVLAVQGVAEEVTVLDDMLATLGDDLMLIALDRAGCMHGLMALDMQFRAAVVEMQTMGVLLGQVAEDRAPTRTDKTLCEPLLRAFLAAFPASVHGTPLEGWVDDLDLGARVESARAAGLVLDDINYRIVRMSVDLGVADRKGMLVLALPVVQRDVPEMPEVRPPIDWQSSFSDAVSEANACLDAVLHRFPVPLQTAQTLQVGTVLPLPGCTVNSVRLIAPDGHCVGQAKLGQAAGHRAVRLETAPSPELGDLPATGTMPLDVASVGIPQEPDMMANALMDQPLEPSFDISDHNGPLHDADGAEDFPDLADDAFRGVDTA